MDPAQPPLPSAWNLPFHFSASGIHTSTLIFESEDGFKTATIRQKFIGVVAGAAGAPPRPPRPPAFAAGTVCATGALSGAGAAPRPGAPAPPRAPPPGKGEPAITNCEVVMVVLGRVRVLRFSQGVAAAIVPNTTSARLLIMMPPDCFRSGIG